MNAEKKAAQEIIEKFGVEYSQIKLANVGELVQSGKNLERYECQPIMQVIKTISGLCKVFINRLKLDKAEEGWNFIVETLKKASACESGETLHVAKYLQETANLHLLQVDGTNAKIYDS